MKVLILDWKSSIGIHIYTKNYRRYICYSKTHKIRMWDYKVMNTLNEDGYYSQFIKSSNNKWIPRKLEKKQTKSVISKVKAKAGLTKN